MVVTCEVSDAEGMQNLGERIAAIVTSGDIVVLTGPLGAGKTTLTQGIARGLNVSGSITSPTFVVSRIHDNAAHGPSLIHVDAYRLRGIHDFADLDIEPLANTVVVVEWGEEFIADLADSWLSITINREDDNDDDPAGGVRQVALVTHGPRWLGRDISVVAHA